MAEEEARSEKRVARREVLFRREASRRSSRGEAPWFGWEGGG